MPAQTALGRLLLPGETVIVRIYRARIRDDKTEAFHRMVRSEVRQRAEEVRGLLYLHVGRQLAGAEERAVMVSVWADMKSMRDWAGPGWRGPVLFPGEDELVSDPEVEIYEVVSAEDSLRLDGG